MSRVAEQLKLLGNPVRMRLVYLLGIQSALSVKAVHELLGKEQFLTLVSQYLRQLQLHGVLCSERRGKLVFYALADPAYFDLLLQLLRVGDSAVQKEA